MYKWKLHPLLFILDSTNDADFMKDSVTKLRTNGQKKRSSEFIYFSKRADDSAGEPCAIYKRILE